MSNSETPLITPVTTSSHRDDRICRICQEIEGEDLFLTPCLCKGSTKYVHTKCLDEWRRINKGKKRARYCEICGFGYTIKTTSPSFLEYVQDSWSYPEKAIYASAAMSVCMSVVASVKAYMRDRRKKPSVIARLSYIAVLFKYYLYGWPARSKVMMYACLVFILWGNSFLFEHWRQKHVKEVVQNYPRIEDSKTKSDTETHCT